MNNFDFFWKTMNKCDWSTEGDGDDDKILKPVVDYLASLDDAKIFEFDSLMTKLLYDLDTKKLFEQCYKSDEYASDDSFLYSRCVALINGYDYYKKVKAGKIKELWTMEFESLLYVPQNAWAKLHNKDSGDYPCVCFLSYETGSNKEMWGEEDNTSALTEKLKIFDKASWHIDNGFAEDEVIEKFTVIFTFLKENDMLNEEGLEFFADGLDDSISLNENVVNENGFEFLEKYYDKVINCSSKDIKQALENVILDTKYCELITKLSNAKQKIKPMKYYSIDFLKGATIKGSKLGGYPYIPVDGEIPTNAKGEPLLMIAQLNLSEIPNSILPLKDGILQFWIGNDKHYGADFENPCSSENSRVLYYPTIEKCLSKKAVEQLFLAVVDLDASLMFPLQKPFVNEFKFRIKKEDTIYICPNDLNFSKILVKKYNELYSEEPILDVFEDILYKAENFSESNLKADRFLNPPMLFTFNGKILGYPDFIQDDPRKNAPKDLQEYILLFQLSSKKFKNSELNWGKEGIARWFIHPKDLKKGDFSKVWYTWDC